MIDQPVPAPVASRGPSQHTATGRGPRCLRLQVHRPTDDTFVDRAAADADPRDLLVLVAHGAQVRRTGGWTIVLDPHRAPALIHQATALEPEAVTVVARAE